MEKEEYHKQILLVCRGGCLQCMDHTGLSQLTGRVLSWSTLLRFQVAL